MTTTTSTGQPPARRGSGPVTSSGKTVIAEGDRYDVRLSPNVRAVTSEADHLKRGTRRDDPAGATARKPICALTAILASIALVTSGCGRNQHPVMQSPSPSMASSPFAIDDQAEQENGDPRAAPSAPPAPAAVDAATGYVQAWARPTLPRAAWYSQLTPLVVAEYGQLLADTDPANVPATAVTGAPRVVSASTATVVVDVPTDAGPIRVSVVNRDGGWLVATVSPASEPS